MFSSDKMTDTVIDFNEEAAESGASPHAQHRLYFTTVKAEHDMLMYDCYFAVRMVFMMRYSHVSVEKLLDKYDCIKGLQYHEVCMTLLFITHSCGKLESSQLKSSSIHMLILTS